MSRDANGAMYATAPRGVETCGTRDPGMPHGFGVIIIGIKLHYAFLPGCI
jgi:hypothetical protein